jgi:hypothetical protein
VHMLVTNAGTVASVVAEPGPATDPALVTCLDGATRSIRAIGVRGPAKVTWTFDVSVGGCLLQ